MLELLHLPFDKLTVNYVESKNKHINIVKGNMDEETIETNNKTEKPSGNLVIEKKKSPVLMIILIIIVVLLVATLAMYYLSSKSINNDKNLPEPLKAGETSPISN